MVDARSAECKNQNGSETHLGSHAEDLAEIDKCGGNQISKNSVSAPAKSTLPIQKLKMSQDPCGSVN